MEAVKDEATISDSQSAEIVEYKKKRNELLVEFGLFLILGILLGVTLKTEAVKRITIGFNDYKLAHARQAYDITAIQKQLMDQVPEDQVQPETGGDQQSTNNNQ